jgi:signal transduction histidine kinase
MVIIFIVFSKMNKPRIICYSQETSFLLRVSDIVRVEFGFNFNILIRQDVEAFLTTVSNPDSETPLILIDEIENLEILEDLLKEVAKRSPRSIKILWINTKNGKAFKRLSVEIPIYRCIIKPYQDIDVILSIRNGVQKFYLDKQSGEKSEQLEESLIEIRAIQDKLMWAEANRQELLAQVEDVNNSLEDEVKRRTKELQETLNNLRSTQKKLVESEKMASLGLLSASIAHEIKNPIGFISGSTASLKADFDDIRQLLQAYETCIMCTNFEDFKAELVKIKELKEAIYFEEIKNEITTIFEGLDMGVKRSMEIINSLNVFSRRDPKTPQRTNLHSNIDSALLILKGKYQKHIKVVTQYAVDISEIICFPSMLNQVFVNIIANAIDSISQMGDQKGLIEISTELRGDKIQISIHDNGIGMSEEVQKKIFDTFFTTKQGQEVEGTGLGLSITNSIIKKHKGEIKVKSQEGKGTSFVIIIPKILKPSQIIN